MLHRHIVAGKLSGDPGARAELQYGMIHELISVLHWWEYPMCSEFSKDAVPQN